MGFLEWFQSTPEAGPPPLSTPEFGPAVDDQRPDIELGGLNPDDIGQDSVPDPIAGVCVAIEYVDPSGAASSRRIVCRKVFQAYETIYLSGFCMLRGENRTFRVDRIRKLRIAPEWVRLPDAAAFFQAYLRPSAEIKKSKWDSFLDGSERYARLHQVRSMTNHGLRVLTFVGRADGAVVNQERKVIQNYVRGVAGLARLELSDDDCAEVASDVDKLFPTKRQVAYSLDVIVHYHEQSELLLESLKALVIADGLRSRREANAIAMLVELLQNRRPRNIKMAVWR